MPVFSGTLVGADDLDVPLVGQDHLKDCLSKDTCHRAMNLGLDKDRPGKTAFSTIDSLVKHSRYVGVFMRLNVEISLSLHHKLCEVSIARGDKCEEVLVSDR